MIVASQREVFDIAAPPLPDLPLVLLKLRLLGARSHHSQTRPCCRAHTRGIPLFSNGFDAVPDQVRRIVPQLQERAGIAAPISHRVVARRTRPGC
jgi:hypothetical protein